MNTPTANVILIAIILLAAFSTILLVDQSIQKISCSTKGVYGFVKLKNGKIEIVNPSTPVEINKIKLIIDENPVNVTDSNKNGIWETWEKIVFYGVKDYDGDGFISVKILINNQLFFQTIYTEPIKINRDKEFPEIKILETKKFEDFIAIPYLITDDVALSSLKIIRTSHKGYEKVLSEINLLDKLMEKQSISSEELRSKLNKEIALFERCAKKKEILSALSSFAGVINLPLGIANQTAYLTIYSKDLTGKISSKVLWLNRIRNLPKVSVKIISPRDGSTFWEDEKVKIKILAVNAKKVTLFVDGEVLFSKNIVDKISHLEHSINLIPGSHKIVALASNNYINVTDAITINVRKDMPPKVEILFPLNNSTLNQIVNVFAVVSDDRELSKIEVYINNVKINQIYLNSTKTYKYYEKVNLTAGNYSLRIKAYDCKNQGISKLVTFSVVIPMAVEIYSPLTKEKLSVGDPPILAIAKGSSNIELLVNGLKIKSIGTKLMDEKFLSTGWFFGKSVFIPEIPKLVGKMKIHIKSFNASNFFQPFVKSGFSNSKGIKFLLHLPTFSEVTFKFGAIYGKAKPELIHHVVVEKDNKIKYIYIYSWKSPENSKALEKLKIKFKPVCMKESKGLKSYFLLIFDTRIRTYENGKLVQEIKLGTLNFGKTVSEDMWEWEKGIPPIIKYVKISSLELMQLSYAPARIEGAPIGCGGVSIEPISYVTVAKDVKILINGKTVLKVSLDDLRPSKIFKVKLPPGKHLIEIKSKIGAFKWSINVRPLISRTSSHATVILPSGKSIKVNNNSGYIPAEFGYFKFDSACVAKIDYYIESICQNVSSEFKTSGLKAFVLFPGSYRISITPLQILKNETLCKPKIDIIYGKRELKEKYKECFGLCSNHPSWAKYWHLWKEGVIYTTSQSVEVEGMIKSNTAYIIGVGLSSFQGKTFIFKGKTWHGKYSLKRQPAKMMLFKAKINPNSLSLLCMNDKCLKVYTASPVRLFIKVNYADQKPTLYLGPWGHRLRLENQWANSTAKGKVVINYKLKVKHTQKPDVITRKVLEEFSKVCLKLKNAEYEFVKPKNFAFTLNSPEILMINTKGQARVKINAKNITQVYSKIYAAYSWYSFTTSGLHQIKAVAYGYTSVTDEVEVKVEGEGLDAKPNIIVLSSDVAEKNYPYLLKAKLIDDKKIIAGEIWIDKVRACAKAFNKKKVTIAFQKMFTKKEIGTHSVKFVAYDDNYQKSEVFMKIKVKEKIKKPKIKKIIIRSALEPVYPFYSVINLCRITDHVKAFYPAESVAIAEAVVEQGEYPIAYVKWGSIDNVNYWPKYVNLCEKDPSKIWWWNWNGNTKPRISYVKPYTCIIFLREPWFYNVQHQLISATACDIKGFCSDIRSLELEVKLTEVQDYIKPSIKILNQKRVIFTNCSIVMKVSDDYGISSVYLWAYNKDFPKKIVILGHALKTNGSLSSGEWSLRINFESLYTQLSNKPGEKKPISVIILAYAKDFAGNKASDKVEMLLVPNFL